MGRFGIGKFENLPNQTEKFAHLYLKVTIYFCIHLRKVRYLSTYSITIRNKSSGSLVNLLMLRIMYMLQRHAAGLYMITMRSVYNSKTLQFSITPFSFNLQNAGICHGSKLTILLIHFRKRLYKVAQKYFPTLRFQIIKQNVIKDNLRKHKVLLYND